MNGGAVAWRSSKQDTITMLSVEVEYIVVSEVAQVAYWMKKFIKELGVVPSIENPVKVYFNNSSTVLLANECITHIGSLQLSASHVGYHDLNPKFPKARLSRLVQRYNYASPLEACKYQFADRRKKKVKNRCSLLLLLRQKPETGERLLGLAYDRRVPVYGHEDVASIDVATFHLAH
ncbi:hypothetical protein Tco_1450143 [Tanacetum coccineum]